MCVRCVQDKVRLRVSVHACVCVHPSMCVSYERVMHVFVCVSCMARVCIMSVCVHACVHVCV